MTEGKIFTIPQVTEHKDILAGMKIVRAMHQKAAEFTPEISDKTSYLEERIKVLKKRILMKSMGAPQVRKYVAN